jgi:hypothetical protein
MLMKLANAFEQYNSHRGCQIQTASLGRHWYRQTIVRVGQKEVFRQPFCFATEHKIISLAELRIPIPSFGFRRQKKSSDWGLGRSFEFSNAFPVLDIHLMPVIHSSATEPAVIDGKTKRFNQVQPTLGRQAKSGDIPCIRRNFRFDQHNVEHVCVGEELKNSRIQEFKNSRSGDPAMVSRLLEFLAFQDS